MGSLCRWLSAQICEDAPAGGYTRRAWALWAATTRCHGDCIMHSTPYSLRGARSEARGSPLLRPLVKNTMSMTFALV